MQSSRDYLINIDAITQILDHWNLWLAQQRKNVRYHHFDVLVQETRNSSASLLSCTNQSIYASFLLNLNPITYNLFYDRHDGVLHDEYRV